MASAAETVIAIEKSGVSMQEHHVVEVRATGYTPEAVTEKLQEVLDEHDASGWALESIQPIIYNSSTTGYLILVFARPRRTAGAEGADG